MNWQYENLMFKTMGHIAHLRKQFKSINTYDYIMMLIKRRKNPLTFRAFSSGELKKSMSIKFIHDLEDSFSKKNLII